MSGRFQLADREQRPVFQILRPSGTHVGLVGLALVEGAHLAGTILDGKAAGCTLAVTAVVGLANACVRRTR
ncbi:hypothetical protein ABT124_51265 [Streptomyces sp. NPDC001982]|uniref:hypothetical protein n=1 Tax=Streptomyces sp. NPDC001982 TaxID=3154405 RepID=UPI003332AAB1